MVMKISIVTKLAVSYLFLIMMVVVLALYSVNVSQESLEHSVGMNSISTAKHILKGIDNEIYVKMEGLQTYSKYSLIQKFVSESNGEFEEMENFREYLDEKNHGWSSAPGDEITPFMRDLLTNELSNNMNRELIDFYRKKYGYNVFGEIFVTNKYGAIVALTSKTSDYKQDDELWWQKTASQGTYAGNVEYDESAGMYSISIGVRVDDENGNFIGVLKAVIPFEWVVKETFEIEKFRTTEIKIMTEKGNLVYSSDAFKFSEDVSDKDFFKNMKDNEGFFIFEEGGKKKLLSYTRPEKYGDFEGMQWIIMVQQDENEVLEPIFILKNNIISFTAILVISGIFIAFSISRSISKPISKLKSAVNKIIEGDLSVRVRVESGDELGEFASGFNQMAETLNNQRNELEKYSENLEKTVKKRTIELESKNEELEKFNKLAIGRELKMVELKKVIRKLGGKPDND